MTPILIIVSIITVIIASITTYILHRQLSKSDNNTTIQSLVTDMISSNSLLNENINNLNTSVNKLNEDVAYLKTKNVELAAQIEAVREMVKGVL